MTEQNKIYLNTKLGEYIKENLGISNTSEFGLKYRETIKIILNKKCSIYIGYFIDVNTKDKNIPSITIIGANMVNEKRVEQQYKFTYKAFLEYK
jgi:hypothetical protein